MVLQWKETCGISNVLNNLSLQNRQLFNNPVLNRYSWVTSVCTNNLPVASEIKYSHGVMAGNRYGHLRNVWANGPFCHFFSDDKMVSTSKAKSELSTEHWALNCSLDTPFCQWGSICLTSSSKWNRFRPTHDIWNCSPQLYGWHHPRNLTGFWKSS